MSKSGSVCAPTPPVLVGLIYYNILIIIFGYGSSGKLLRLQFESDCLVEGGSTSVLFQTSHIRLEIFVCCSHVPKQLWQQLMQLISIHSLMLFRVYVNNSSKRMCCFDSLDVCACACVHGHSKLRQQWCPSVCKRFGKLSVATISCD